VLWVFHERPEIKPLFVTDEYVLCSVNVNSVFNYSRENNCVGSMKLLLCCGYFMRPEFKPLL
jgi:hypothetical protein